MRLTHPNTSRVLDVDPDHVGPYLTQGWVVAPVEEPVDLGVTLTEVLSTPPSEWTWTVEESSDIED